MNCTNEELQELANKVKEKYPEVSDVDYYQEDSNDKDLFICWLKAPYVTMDSEGGFSVFRTLEDLDKIFNEYPPHKMDKEELRILGVDALCNYGIDIDDFDYKERARLGESYHYDFALSKLKENGIDMSYLEATEEI